MLNTHEGLGAEFFPYEPKNLFYNHKLALRVFRLRKRLLEEDYWLDAVVEKRWNQYYIKETKMLPL